MHGFRVYHLFGLICALWFSSPALACTAWGFAGERALPAWDVRDALAEQVEADGAALGLPPTQTARIAWALRLGMTAAPALTQSDLAVLRALDRGCDPQTLVSPVTAEQPFGFDLRLGWRQLVASGAFSAIAVAGLVIAARVHAIRRRRHKRYFCSRPVQCVVAGELPRPCRVEDVSLSGMRVSLRGARQMDLGARVVLQFGTMQLDGRVVRVGRHLTEMDFDRSLTRAELLHLVRPDKYPAPSGVRSALVRSEPV